MALYVGADSLVGSTIKLVLTGNFKKAIAVVIWYYKMAWESITFKHQHCIWLEYVHHSEVRVVWNKQIGIKILSRLSPVLGLCSRWDNGNGSHCANSGLRGSMCVCCALPLPIVTLQHSHANAFILSNWIHRQLIRHLRYPDEPNKMGGHWTMYVDLVSPALQSLPGHNLVARRMLVIEDVEGKCFVFELTFISASLLRRWM